MRIHCYIIMIFLLISPKLSADTFKRDTVERGFAYQNEKTNEAQKDNINKDARALLSEMLKVQKEQRDIQKEILRILKAEYDPEPKIIVNENGEECVANSSADCFLMPVTAEAKKVPVIREWLEKRDLESSVKKKQWLAKYFNEITKAAYNDVFAISHFGTEAYPVDYNTMNYNNTINSSVLVKEKHNQEVLRRNLDKINLIYFIGKNESFDLYAMDNIVKFLKNYKDDIKLQFIFNDEKSYKAYSTASMYNKDFQVLNNFKMKVAPEEFEEFNISNTPSLVAINKAEKTALTVMTGRASENRATNMLLMYLKNQGIIEDVELNINNAWREDKSYGKKYIKDLLGEKFLKSLEETK